MISTADRLLEEIVRRLDNPDPREDQQAYNIDSTKRNIRVYLNKDRKHEPRKGMEELSCYYCRPSGYGSNDDDVILPGGKCPCWCHGRKE